MNDEQFDWENFIKRYSQELENLKIKLELINRHPETFEELDVDFIAPDKLDERIKDWLWLLGKLTHPLETNFFEPTWVPLEKNGYARFTDICNSDFPVFESNYKFIDQMFWYNLVLTKNIDTIIYVQEFDRNNLGFLKRNRRNNLQRTLGNPLFNFNDNPGFKTERGNPKKKRKKKIGEGNEGKGKLSL